jgi:hypothetical protein
MVSLKVTAGLTSRDSNGIVASRRQDLHRRLGQLDKSAVLDEATLSFVRPPDLVEEDRAAFAKSGW